MALPNDSPEDDTKGKVGEWVRHTSSSGKEYYFHVSKQTSQWEKPREWLEYEKRHGLVPSVYVSSSQRASLQAKAAQGQSQGHHQQQGHSNTHQQNSSSTNHVSEAGKDVRKTYQQHQQQQQNANANAHHHSHPQTGSQSHAHHQNNQNHGRGDHHPNNAIANNSVNSISLGRNDGNKATNNNAATSSSSASLRDSRKPSEDLQTEDMDISPLDDSNSPPNSTESRLNHTHPNFLSHHHHHQQHHPSNFSHSQHFQEKNLQEGGPHPHPHHHPDDRSSFHHQQHHHSHPQQQHGRLNVLGNNNNNNNGYYSRDRDRSEREGPRGNSPRRIGDSSNNSNSGSFSYSSKEGRDYREGSGGYRDKDSRDRDRMMRRERESPRGRYANDGRDHGRGGREGRDRDRHNKQHSSNRHRSNSRLRDDRDRSRSPRDRDGTPERSVGGGGGSGMAGLGSLGALAALNSDSESTPMQSLAQYFRHDLIGHAQDLPGDDLEQQANRLSDEIMTTNALQLLKVCAELKMARSQVRVTDIQATLQDQRIMYLRQEIKCLEENDHNYTSEMMGLDSLGSTS